MSGQDRVNAVLSDGGWWSAPAVCEEIKRRFGEPAREVSVSRWIRNLDNLEKRKDADGAQYRTRKTAMNRLISEIEVGERFRDDVGDIATLVESIKRLGLLHPVVVTTDGRLIAGARRLEACKVLGWKKVPVRIAERVSDAAALLRAERDENTCRLDMKPSEKARLGMALEAVERPKAKERQGRPDQPRSENFTEHATGDTRDIVGEAVGMSGVTYERAKAVVEKADEGDPIATEALGEMDQTGKVFPAYRKAVKQTLSPRQQDMADAAYRRWRKMIGTLLGITEGLDRFPVDRVLAIATDEELGDWCEVIRGATRALTKVRKSIDGGTQ